MQQMIFSRALAAEELIYISDPTDRTNVTPEKQFHLNFRLSIEDI